MKTGCLLTLSYPVVNITDGLRRSGLLGATKGPVNAANAHGATAKFLAWETSVPSLLLEPLLDKLASSDETDWLVLESDVAAPPPPDNGPSEPSLPLVEYFRSEACWYHAHSAEGSGLCADVIDELARSAYFHHVASISELIAQSPRYRKATLDSIAIPAERRTSRLAEVLDCEAHGYLLVRNAGDAAKLIAWALVHRADLAEDLNAHTEADYFLKLEELNRDEQLRQNYQQFRS